MQLASALTEKWRVAEVARPRVQDLETLVELSTDALQRSNARLADADEPGRRAPLRNLLGQGQGLCRACCQGAGRRLQSAQPDPRG